MKFVAVTSCPTGIAHTYMAAEALEQAAKAAGHEVAVETQGSAGAQRLTPQQIAEADAVIFAADVEVRDRDRFAGKPLVVGGVKRAISSAPAMLAEAEEAAARQPAAAGGGPPPTAAVPVATGPPGGPHFGIRLRGWLMTGVSYMIPFVAAGGILIALSFVLGGAEIANKVNGGTFQGVKYPGVTDLSQLWEQTGFAGVLFKIGAVTFSMLVPILAGFIAYAMADRLGLVPGIVGGLIANAIGAGFLGGLVAGLLAGAVAMWLGRIQVPRAVRGVMPVVVIPLVSAFVVGFLMLVVVGEPIAAATRGMNSWMNGLSGTNAVLLGVLIGLMMCFDLGGPVNKVAYTFGVAALAGAAGGQSTIMAAVMAAGMMPPIALALATVLRRALWTEAEREAGEAAWLLGASFISEGAIPFAAADPVRVIPSMMIGGAVTGGLSMAFGASSPAPHGGIWVVGLIGKPLLWVLAILIGSVVSAVCVLVAKSIGRPTAVEAVSAPAPGLAAARA
ncbi:MAG TPA: fructose-specific PTS transporter subunit EIIC [Pseudonocardiaceae bacterium]